MCFLSPASRHELLSFVYCMASCMQGSYVRIRLIHKLQLFDKSMHKI